MEPASRKKTNIEPDEVGSVTVPPGGMERLTLGTFGSDDLPPRFHVVYQTGQGSSVGHHDVRIPESDGTYRIVRNFQNFGDRAITVYVTWVSGGKPLA